MVVLGDNFSRHSFVVKFKMETPRTVIGTVRVIVRTPIVKHGQVCSLFIEEACVMLPAKVNCRAACGIGKVVLLPTKYPDEATVFTADVAYSVGMP